MHPSNRVQTAPLQLHDLARRYSQIRGQSEALAAPLSAEDCQLQSMPDASPTKWHLAHLTWFFETFILEKYERSFKPFDASFRVLFNSYYTGIGDRYPRPKRGLISRPSLDQIYKYRQQIDDRVLRLLHSPAGRADDGLAKLIELGLQHEQQHQELILTDIKHALSFNPLAPAYGKRWPLTRTRPEPQRWHVYAGGMVEHGFDAAVDGQFSFDNETPRHPVFIAPFELANRLVTNGDLMAFMADGGYQRPEFWLSMGWDWVQCAQRELPFYWERSDQNADAGVAYRNFTLQGMVEIDPNTPACHLNFFEADALARWAGARLPTEFEWELAARALPATGELSGNFVEHAAYHPLPLSGSGEDAPAQMLGDVWSGRNQTTTPTRATSHGKAWSANTTASSCATNSCCGAGHAPHRAATCGPATAISFPQMRSGSSAVSGWRAMHDCKRKL